MRTSTEWLHYYEHNAQTLREIPWHIGDELTSEEREAISSSVQGFQLGESSEGKHLFRDAQNYASRTGDPDYVEVIRLFIAEEQRHARDLAHFLQLNGIPLIKSTFPDRVFRRLRHMFGGLEISIAVLITAEIIAKVYYAALKNATNSSVLRTLCDQILSDEEKHVEFQAEQLGKLRAHQNVFFHLCTMGVQRFLFWGTCFVVWRGHKKAFRRGGFSFGQFWKSCWSEFNQAFTISKKVISQLKKDVVTKSEPVDQHIE